MQAVLAMQEGVGGTSFYHRHVCSMPAARMHDGSSSELADAGDRTFVHVEISTIVWD